MNLNPSSQAAIEDFRRMRRRAGLQNIFNRFRRHSSLLSYEDVRQQLRAIERSGSRLREIPLDAIQGSVGRYTDFTRDFLPTGSIDQQRWARVKAQFYTQEGIPPIEVYQISQVYFVSDGNHRVSAARAMGSSTIEAYVRLDQIIQARACWADLVIMSVKDKHTNQIQSLVQSCPTLLMVTKSDQLGFKSILLAYDGSPKSEEALFLAAYLATFWELSLRVITILEKEQDHVNPETIVHAKEFLDYYGVPATYQETEHEPAESILKTAQDHSCDLIVMGGYSTHTRTRRRVLDAVFEKFQQTILICR
jgi:nucleotide-binding universal stress UspA family protein